MLSVLTVDKAGCDKTIEMFHSSPEGKDLCYLVGIFLSRYGSWDKVVLTKDEDVVALRDGNGDYWIAQSVVYESICMVEHN